MQARSDVLFIIICSNNKLPHGESYAACKHDDRVANHIDPKLVSRLMATRREILKLIRENPVAHLGGIPVRDLPLSRGLTTGPDFEVSAEAPSGQYMPAIKRYNGGFYLGMGRDRLERVRKTKHHILIVSGLYGLVTPFELIQSYSCHVKHHPKIPAAWRSHDLLSTLIGSYIARHKITMVFDLMADDDYRRLIAWEVVRNTTKGTVLHAFSNMYAGAAALPSFGTLLDKLLDTSTQSLRKIKSGDAIAVEELGTDVTFVDYPDPPSSPATVRLVPSELDELRRKVTPHQQDARVTHSDLVGRMRRNYLKAMADILLLGAHDSLDFMPRVDAVLNYERDPRVRDAYLRLLRKFNRIRKEVEYERRVLTLAEIKGLVVDYKTVMNWLRQQFGNRFNNGELESVD